MAQTYDKKYGINSADSNVEAFHRQRTMFVIKDDKLYVAESGLDYSHAIWFEKMGWMTADNDQMMDHVTRGYRIFQVTGSLIDAKEFVLATRDGYSDNK